MQGLAVAESYIPSGGLGLFTTQARAQGEEICYYTGTQIRFLDALRLPDKSYLMRLGPQCYIDARQHADVAARYINDCRNSRGYNARFDKRPAEGRAAVIATRDIAAGAELFVDYG